MRWEKTSKIFKFPLQKPGNFPFIKTEERPYEVAAWVINFLLNLLKERFCLVNIDHRISWGKMIYINREAAWPQPRSSFWNKIWWEFIFKGVDLIENWIKSNTDLGRTCICKLTLCFYLQQENCDKINVSVIFRKGFDVAPQRKLLFKSLNIGINVTFVRMNKDFQTYLALSLLKNQLEEW